MQILDGRYQIVRELGSGGFGQTYVAEDIRLYNRKCVVKQFKPLATDSHTLQVAKRLFDAEAETLYKLGSHDRIPQLLAHFEENGEFYLVQEFIDGRPLDREITAGKPLSESYAIALLQGILEPLAFVHQQKVIHRDIKPANLIRRASDNKIVLIDFGAVKQIPVTQVVNPQGQTRLTVAIGTPGYMPSEQSRGIPRLSSDIYAVGMTIVQALTGILPEALPEDPHTAEIIWRDRIRITAGLGDILERMVRYDFRQRYPSAFEALQALQQLTGTPSPGLESLSPKFDTYGFPSYLRVTHLGGQSTPQTDGSYLTWDAFASNDPPDMLIEYYQQQLGDTGFTRENNGGNWSVRSEGSIRDLSVLPIDASGPHRQYDNLRSPNARSAIVVSAKSLPTVAIPVVGKPVGWGFWFLWLLANAVSIGVGILLSIPAYSSLYRAMGDIWTAVLLASLVGATTGLGQWLFLRRQIAITSWWILATAIASAIGMLAIPSAYNAVSADNFSGLLYPLKDAIGIISAGVLAGVAMGLAQWLVLRRQYRSRISRLWILANALGGAVGLAFLIPTISHSFSIATIVIIVLGIVAFVAITGWATIWLLRRSPAPSPPTPVSQPKRPKTGWRFQSLWVLATATGLGLSLFVADPVAEIAYKATSGSDYAAASALLLVTSATVSFLQWLLLEQWMPKPQWWVLASILGSLAGGNLGAGVGSWATHIRFNYGLSGIGESYYLRQGIVFGLLLGTTIGLAQWLVLRYKYRIRSSKLWMFNSKSWILTTILGSAMGTWVAMSASRGVGSFAGITLGGVVFGAVTGYAMGWLLRRSPVRNY